MEAYAHYEMARFLEVWAKVCGFLLQDFRENLTKAKLLSRGVHFLEYLLKRSLVRKILKKLIQNL